MSTLTIGQLRARYTQIQWLQNSIVPSHRVMGNSEMPVFQAANADRWDEITAEFVAVERKPVPAIPVRRKR